MFRFSIRELMLASALIGVSISWVVSLSNESAIKSEMEQQKERAVLIDRVIRYADCTVVGDAQEIIFTTPKMKVRSFSRYLDNTPRNNGANRRIWSYQPEFPDANSSTQPAW